MNSIGIIPLYLALYDERRPELRTLHEPLLTNLVQRCRDAGLAVHLAPICRVAAEVAAAVCELERSGAELLATVHLAYSPSLEAAPALAACPLPLVLLDTTRAADFGPGTDPTLVPLNHGIHGVQDLAAVLRRMGRAFTVLSGHLDRDPIIPRLAEHLRGRRAAAALRRARILRLGHSFPGMGDFAVDDGRLRDDLGVTVVQAEPEALATVAAPTSGDLDAELHADRGSATVAATAATHRRSVAVGLRLRRLLDAGGYAGFSANFLAFTTQQGAVDTVPFLEAGKAMARGLGYAGEGDVLTAALVGALLAAWPETTFTEMFCPDWAGGRVFCSHMGEANPRCLAPPWTIGERPMPYLSCAAPALVLGRFKPGSARLVNLGLGPRGFEILHAGVQVDGTGDDAGMAHLLRGWFRPPGGVVGPFLEAWASHGGTHHSALSYGASAAGIAAFAAGLGVPAMDLDKELAPCRSA